MSRASDAIVDEALRLDSIEYKSGLKRSPNEDRTEYSLVFDGPMLKRWAIHLTPGIKRFGKRNWMKSHTEEDYERFRDSAARHFTQWMDEETDEDHAAAVMFNINGAEYVKQSMVLHSPEFKRLKEYS